jgi:hypothetical protein
MVSKAKISEIIGAIRSIYPYYAKDGMIAVTANVWERVLQNYNDEEVSAAFYSCLQSCKVPPTPADIIERINGARKALEPSNEQLWGVYYDALIRTLDLMAQFSYTFVESDGISQGQKARNKVDKLYEGLPSKIKEYLGSKGELMRIARSINTQDASFEKARFLKAMPSVEKSQEARNLLGGASASALLERGEF